MKNFFRIAFSFLSAMLGASYAFAQVSVSPVTPKAFETVRLQTAPGAIGPGTNGNPDRFNPQDTEITMVGNKITVSLLMRGRAISSPIPAVVVDQPIGQLPSGTYTVEVVKRAVDLGSPGVVGSTTFTVAPKTPADPIWDLTDMWYNPLESGWGVSIVQHPSKKLFVVLYVYGADGKPTWYVLPDGAWNDSVNNPTFEGTAYKTTGPYFGGPFNPSLVGVTAAGIAKIEIDPSDYTHATVNFQVDGINFLRSVNRQGF